MTKSNVLESPLFEGISSGEAEAMLQCLSAVRKDYKKGGYIFHRGDSIRSIGVVATGAVEIINEDYWGRRQILNYVTEGQLFGESYACTQGEPLMVSAVAAAQTEILFLDINHILTACPAACTFHTRLIRNLLSILSGHNLMLTRKINHMSQKTIREKLLSYLSWQAAQQGSRTFSIPFNRQQLADYLSIDRSALSAELSKMQKDELLSYQKNQFTLRKGMKY